MPRTLILTPAQEEHVTWAFGAMSDYWGAQCEPGNAPDPEAEGVTENGLSVPEGALMPFIGTQWNGRANVAALHLSTWDEVNDDLAYRIGDQLVDMAADAYDGDPNMTPQKCSAVARSARLLGSRIREAMEAAGE